MADDIKNQVASLDELPPAAQRKLPNKTRQSPPEECEQKRDSTASMPEQPGDSAQLGESTHEHD